MIVAWTNPIEVTARAAHLTMWWTAALIALPAVVLAASSCPAEVSASDPNLRALDVVIMGAVNAASAGSNTSLVRAKQLALFSNHYSAEEIGRYIRKCQPQLDFDDTLSGDYKAALDAINVTNYCPNGEYSDCLLYLKLLHQQFASTFPSPARESYSNRCNELYANPGAAPRQLAFCLSVANSSRPTFSVLQRYGDLIKTLPNVHQSAYQALMVVNTPVLCAAQFFLKSEDMAIFCKDAYGSIYGHFKEIGSTMENDSNDILNAGAEGNQKLVEEFPDESYLLKEDLDTSFTRACGEIRADTTGLLSHAQKYCRMPLTVDNL